MARLSRQDGVEILLEVLDDLGLEGVEDVDGGLLSRAGISAIGDIAAVVNETWSHAGNKRVRKKRFRRKPTTSRDDWVKESRVEEGGTR